MSATSAALVIIGAEVLSGKVDDQNAPFLIRALRERGVQVSEIRTIGDDVAVIAATVRALSQQVTHVFTTGGIGPTHDDITAECKQNEKRRQQTESRCPKPTHYVTSYCPQPQVSNQGSHL